MYYMLRLEIYYILFWKILVMKTSRIKTLNQTSTSMRSKGPLQETSMNCPAVVTDKIQELSFSLRKEQSELREAKLETNNLREKGESQEARLNDIKIQLDYQLEAGDSQRHQLCILKEDLFDQKTSIRQICKDLQQIKPEAEQKLTYIASLKKKIGQTISHNNLLDHKITSVSQTNDGIEQDNKYLSQLIINKENQTRASKDKLTQCQIQQSQLSSLIQFLQEKINKTMKTKNETLKANSHLNNSINLIQKKIYSLDNENKEVDWQCDQLINKNVQIEELNDKISQDLEYVFDHITAAENMNKLLMKSLSEFENTGKRVSKIIDLTSRE